MSGYFLSVTQAPDWLALVGYQSMREFIAISVKLYIDAMI